MTNHATDRSRWPADAMSGTWHLVDHAADEVNVPKHRMDLRFDHGPSGLRAVVLSRVNGEEMPVVRRASFDGEVLELQMIGSARSSQAEMPVLVMTVDGARLLGSWQQQGAPMGPGLKLVRAHHV